MAVIADSVIKLVGFFMEKKSSQKSSRNQKRRG
jgi:hypothetical protein